MSTDERYVLVRRRAEELEDAITEAGLILSAGELDGDLKAAIRDAMACLGSVMNDPAVLKRQGI